MEIVGERGPGAFLNGAGLSAEAATSTERRLEDLRGFFRDERARSEMPGATPVYGVQVYMPVEEGTEGGLFFGYTTVQPGMVGNEYFMTKGHFHDVLNRSEYYWCISGHGYLLLFDRTRAWAEQLSPGSLHYIPGETAHRLVNTGSEALTVGACWPADAGHDYGPIRERGFPLMVISDGGSATLVENPNFTTATDHQ